MTAIATRPLSDSSEALLRFALRADATFCGALGLVVAFAVAVGVLAADVLPLTGAGVAMMLATVAATLGCAAAQYYGVRRLA